MEDTLTWVLINGLIQLIYTDEQGRQILLLSFAEKKDFDSYIKNTLEFQDEVNKYLNPQIPQVFEDAFKGE